jgi:hypothetical protein
MGGRTTERHRAMNLLTKLASDVRERTEQLKLRDYTMTEIAASGFGCCNWCERGCAADECNCLNVAKAIEKFCGGQP